MWLNSTTKQFLLPVKLECANDLWPVIYDAVVCIHEIYNTKFIYNMFFIGHYNVIGTTFNVSYL